MDIPRLHQLTIEHLAPSLLQPDPKNPRAHQPPQIAAIARSIKTFGFNVPVVTDGIKLLRQLSQRLLALHGSQRHLRLRKPTTQPHRYPLYVL